MTACSVATSVDSVKDPTPSSFQGIDLEDMEVHNQVEGKIDSRFDLKAVDTGKLVVEQQDRIEVGTVPGTEVG